MIRLLGIIVLLEFIALLLSGAIIGSMFDRIMKLEYFIEKKLYGGLPDGKKIRVSKTDN